VTSFGRLTTKSFQLQRGFAPDPEQGFCSMDPAGGTAPRPPLFLNQVGIALMHVHCDTGLLVVISRCQESMTWSHSGIDEYHDSPGPRQSRWWSRFAFTV